ncbi:Membrane fusion component of tripartite multidrug resistance system [plant metagenome]|uniref:Membrane fusion component of tripartite multidrug resistance system n=1 Tax=plant metagenome TaxID=1297885 RepID=A0A484UPJ1_9ZZZZ
MNAPVAPRPAARKRLLILAGIGIAAVAVAYGAWWTLVASHYEATDDAYVHGNLVQITPRLAGTVVAIEADDTDTVRAGQPLVRLDAADADVALAQAKARLAQTVRQTRTLYVQNDALDADVNVRRADISRAQAELARARSDWQRRQALSKSGGVSGEEILHARTALQSAESGLAQAQAQLAAAQAKLATNQALTQGTDVAHHPDVLQAASALRQAWLDASRATLPAPADGMIAQRSVQVGQRVAPGTPLMTVVPLDQVWVEANFKEGQLREMRVGQPATVVADLYGKSVTYHGTVVGLDAGTGSAFALLPAQNATGNWIKVVQRVPVRIALDPETLRQHPLRVGLSMNVEVDVSAEPATPPTRSGPALSTRAFDAESAQADTLIEQIITSNLSA